MEENVFAGCMPALMTPCDEHGVPDFEVLTEVALDLMQKGMDAVVYCGSMGDWPLLSIDERKQGVAALVKAGVPTVVGTGAQSTAQAEALAAHAAAVGAVGLMVIPRLLSRGTSVAAQRNHFKRVLDAAPELPAVIYNSPYYGYETQAGLFNELRQSHPNLVGFKEFGGADALTYAAEHITSGDPDLSLMVGVDTQVVHGLVRCGAVGAITGVGNALPEQVLLLMQLCDLATQGDQQAMQYAQELESALQVLSSFDEGPDLVLYYKHLMVLAGHEHFFHHINHDDALLPTQKAFINQVWQQFHSWWDQWSGRNHIQLTQSGDSSLVGVRCG